MRLITKLAICLFVLLSTITFSLSAQTLSSLPKASEVATGTLPNGISYYLVSNKDVRGHADFALVQKGAADEAVAKAALTELPHFQSGRPYQYLAKLGVGYKKYGSFRSTDHSVTYHFQNVPVDRLEVRDTTLLLLFDISETCPYEQAMIICGDIDRNAVQERMNVFSMMVTSREKVPDPAPASWEPAGDMRFSYIRTAPQAEAVLSFSYSSPRTPREMMGTVQPLVTDLFSRELGVILTDRAEKVLRDRGIPSAGSEWEHKRSADGPDEERYTFSVTVPSGSLDDACSALASVLSDLDANGASLQEFKSARDRVLSMAGQSLSGMTNTGWVEKCESAFLYGSDLASQASINAFFLSRDVDPEREQELFNNFVSALFLDNKSLLIKYMGPGDPVSAEHAKDVFSRGWSAPETAASAGGRTINQNDTLGLYVPKVKAKLKRTVPEPVTGGELWTFSNGMRVIYKKSTAMKGVFSFGFMTNGGYSSVSGLSRGEGGFVADILSLCDVAGMPGWSFRRMLETNGVSFTPSASLTDLRITGTAPSSKLQLVLKSLLSVTRDRTLDYNAYEYYRASERLRLSVDRKRQGGIYAVVDSIMCPDFIHTGLKYAEGLSDDLPLRAEEYFSTQFGKCDDGVLVIVGDLDPFMMKKVLPKYIGGFVTGGLPAPRPQIQYNLRSGWSTYTVDTDESTVGNGDPCVNVAGTVIQPFTVDNYFISKVTEMELRKKLASSLSETGMYFDLSSEFDQYPVEKFSVRVSCRQSDEDGLPDGVSVSDPLKVLGAVRSALSELSSGQTSSEASGLTSPALSKASVNASKATLLAQYENQLSNPSALVGLALLRYSGGKDLVTGWKDRINAVTPDAVKSMLSALDSGSKVEFVIY